MNKEENGSGMTWDDLKKTLPKTEIREPNINVVLELAPPDPDLLFEEEYIEQLNSLSKETIKELSEGDLGFEQFANDINAGKISDTYMAYLVSIAIPMLIQTGNMVKEKGYLFKDPNEYVKYCMMNTMRILRSTHGEFRNQRGL